MKKLFILLFFSFLLLGCASKDAANNQNISVNQTIQSNSTNQTIANNLTNFSNQTNFTQPISTIVTDFNLSTTVINKTTSENKTETEKEGNGIKFGGYALLLDDVVIYGPDQCAVIKIFDNGLATVLHEGVVCKGKDYYWIAPDKHRYRILITEIAAGYSNNSIWAKVFIYG